MHTIHSLVSTEKLLQNSSVSLWSWRHFTRLLEARGKISVTISQPLPRWTIDVCSHMFYPRKTPNWVQIWLGLSPLYFSTSSQSFRWTVPVTNSSRFCLSTRSLWCFAFLSHNIAEFCAVLYYDWLVIDITNQCVDIGLFN